MGRKQWLRFELPDEESWAELLRDLKLSPPQAAALRGTLREVDERCRELAAEFERSENKRGDNRRALEAVHRALVNVERRLQHVSVRKALEGIETRGALSFLISPEAGAEIHGQTGLDQTQHDRLLDAMTPEVMLFLLQSIRRPVAAELKNSAKAGNTPKTDRELLLCLLARDAREIIDALPATTANGSFHNLCTWVFGACNIDPLGLEEAISRCLKKHGAWLGWSLSPSPEHIVGHPSAAEIVAIPDDPEAGLTC